MTFARYLAVSVIITPAMILHELFSESLFSSLPFTTSETGWWLIGLALLAYVKFVERKKLSSLGFRRPSLQTVLTASAGLALAVTGVAVVGLITQMLGISFEETAEKLSEASAAPLWMMGLFILRAGIIEELFFRGFFMTRAIEFGIPPAATLIMATAFFVAPHALYWNPQHLILVTIAGLSFRAIYLWRRDVVACMLAHIGFNLGGIIASQFA